jgi:hypothetical protein
VCRTPQTGCHGIAAVLDAIYAWLKDCSPDWMNYRSLLLPAACAVALYLSVQPLGLSADARAPAHTSATDIHTGAVDIQMKSVNFRLARDIILEVRTLRGRLQPTRPEVPVTFDDNNSFNVDVDAAQIAITPASMSALMNSYVFAGDHAPLRNISLRIDGDRLIQKGTIHKGVDIPFEIEGALSTTEDGNIRLHASKIKSAHIPVKGLLHLFGEDLSKLINQNAARGVSIAGDDIILAPSTLTPPPHLKGRVTRVSIADGKIVQFFDSGRHVAALTPPAPVAAYIYHRGGILRFGKLTMNDADLEIVGDRPGLFDFFQREYQKQLVAGYSKTTSANGLVAHMVDYSHLDSNASRQNR